MPAPNEMAWYKWFPAKALTSLRWTTLTLEEEGFYRRLYDLAALAQPSARRGWFYEHGRPAPMKEVFHALRIHHSKGYALLKQLGDKGMMKQDENGAWGFPNFSKHQRRAHLRPRPDGLGSSEEPTESGQNRDKIGAIEAEADVNVFTDVNTEAEGEGENIPPPSSSEVTEVLNLARQFATKACWPVEDESDLRPLCKHLRPLVERGDDVSAAIEKYVVPDMKPWELRDKLHPSPTKMSPRDRALAEMRRDGPPTFLERKRR